MTYLTKKRLRKIFFTILFALIIAFLEQHGYIDLKTAAKESAETVQNLTPGMYQIAKFDDGDTIQVVMDGHNETVRFIGVDTPETHDPRKPVQCYGKEASNFTEQLIGQNKVRLEADPLNSNRDRYDRLLRYVYLPDGTLLNQKLVESGYGFVTYGFPFEKKSLFAELEKQAASEGRGLWGACPIEQIGKQRHQTGPAALTP